MKIAIDIRSAAGNMAGKGIYTLNLVKNLLKYDDKNEYFLYTNAHNPSFESFKNAKEIVIKKKSLLWHYAVLKHLKRLKADLFFAPSSFIIPAFMQGQTKSITTIHDLVAILYPEGHEFKARFVENFLIKRVLKKSNKILVVSENTKNDLVNNFSINQSKINIVHCGFDPKFKALNLKREKYILSVGTISPRKNYKNLIIAMRILKKKYNSDLRLKIVGKKGWKYDEVFKTIEKYSLNKDIEVLDYVSNEKLIKLYNKAFCLAFPSFYEGFGIPPLEAMQCETPVVASIRSSIPEVVGDAALAIDPSSPEDIAEKIMELQDEATYSNLQKKGLKQIEKFSWEKSALKLLRIINSME